MKKRIVFALLALTVLLSLAACGKTAEELLTDEKVTVTEDNTEVKTDETKESEKENGATAIINKAWKKMDEDKQFPVMGGDFDAPVDGKAGNINIKNTENTTSTFHISQKDLDKVLDAGALTHMMNANTFTCASYHVKSEDAASFASSLKDSIKNTQWMCGFPETLVIYTVKGEYIVAAFGNGEAIDNFETGLSEAFGSDAALTVEESLA